MENSVDPDQTAVCSGSTLFASILKGDSNPHDKYALSERAL